MRETLGLDGMLLLGLVQSKKEQKCNQVLTLKDTKCSPRLTEKKIFGCIKLLCIQRPV